MFILVLFQHPAPVPGAPGPSIFHISTQPEPDKKLTDWLKEQGADSETVDKVTHTIYQSFPQHSYWLTGFFI